MYEGRKGGSKEGSSKGNKQRQTGLCLPVTLLKWGGLLQDTNTHPLTLTHTHWGAQTTLTSMHAHTQPFSLRPNGDPVVPLLRHTHTHASKPCPGRQQMYMWVICVSCVHALMCVFVHTWICQHQCQGVGYCCLGPKQTPVTPPPIASLSAHEETGRGAQRRWRVNGGEREKNGEEQRRREKEKRKEKKRATEGEGLDSCLLPSLEASSSQSWGVCLPLVVLSSLLFIVYAICPHPPHTHTSFHLFQPKITDLTSSFHHKMCAV